MKKFFNFFKDFLIISKRVEDYEIIIRTLTCPKHVAQDGTIPERKLNEYFLPNKGGVSVNRYRYTNENKSKAIGKTLMDYRGFGLFNIEMFNNCISEYNNPNFRPQIISSPLDESNNYIGIKRVFTYMKGNLSHADIIYPPIDPENPNTSLRVFSKNLARKCIKKLDSNIENDKWTDEKFSKSIKNYFISSKKAVA